MDDLKLDRQPTERISSNLSGVAACGQFQ